MGDELLVKCEYLMALPVSEQSTHRFIQMKSSEVAEIASFVEFAVVKVALPSYHRFLTNSRKYFNPLSSFLLVVNVVV